MGRVSRAVFLVAGAVALASPFVFASCTSSGNASLATSTGGGADGSVAVALACGTPAEGCACASPGETASCGYVDHVSSGYVSCSKGVFTCGSDGTWSACRTETSGDGGVQAASRTYSFDNLQMNAGDACASPCDPACLSYVDTANGVDASLDSGLVWNEAGVSLAPVYPDAGPACTALAVSPAMQTITIDSLSPFHATYPSGQTYSVSVTPSNCYIGTPPALWIIDRYDIATMGTATGLLALLVGEATPSPMTITAFSGALSATAQATVKVNVLDTTNAGTYSNASTYFPATATTADPMKVLYPLDATMFPLGLPPPLVQWDNGGSAATAVKVTIRYPDTNPIFSWSAITTTESPASSTISELVTTPSLPAAPRIDIPAAVWSAFEQTAKGNPSTSPATIAVQRYYGSSTHVEKAVHFRFATGQLKGTVYYNSYGTNLVKNYASTYNGQQFGAATLGVKIGSPTPTLVAGFGGSTNGNGCRVCHSVAANGHYLVTQEFNGGSDNITDWVDLTTSPGTAVPIPGVYNPYGGAGLFAWAGLEPNGTYFLSNSSPLAGGTSGYWSYLFSAVTGGYLATNFPAVQAAMPVFSPDGNHVAFNFYGGSSGSLNADAKSIAMVDYNPAAAASSSFSNFRVLDTPGTGTDYWPSFTPPQTTGNPPRGVVYERELQGNGRDWGATRSQCDQAYPASCQNVGVEAELWWTTATGTPSSAKLTKANGSSLTSTNSHDIDAIVNYEPTMLPQAAGGFGWMVFTSRRLYGNVATVNPYWSDPRYQDLSVQPTPKKLWVAAIDLNAAAGADPSFSAFYLPGQELLAGNSRGAWVLNACEAPDLITSTCDSDLDCCGAPATARCVIDPGATSPPVKHCLSIPSTTTCAPDGASCAIIGCCGALTGSQCITSGANKICQAPPPLVSYSGASFTRDYVANNCPEGYAPVWRFFSWQSNTPADSRITFTAQSADTVAAILSPSSPVPVAVGTALADPTWAADGWMTPSQTPGWWPVSGNNTVDQDLRAAGQTSRNVLRMTATLTPSSAPAQTPVLQDWQATYDCKATQ